MKNRSAVIGTVGVISGFILGFFVAQVTLRDQAPVPVQAAANAAGALPENHPDPEVIDLLRRLQEHASTHPEDSRARVLLANAYYDMKRFDVAIRWYEEAIRLVPDDVSVSTDLGTSYYFVGDSTKAIENFNRSLQLDPTHAQTLQNLGVVYEAMGRNEQAAQAWKKLIQHHPDYEHAEQIRDQIGRVEAELRGDPGK